MLTVASPRASEIDVALRARSVKKAIEQLRASLATGTPQPRVSIVVSFPQSVAAEEVKMSFRLVDELGVRSGAFRDPHVFQGPGFIGIDVSSELDDAALRAWGDRVIQEHFHRSEIHPDPGNRSSFAIRRRPRLNWPPLLVISIPIVNSMTTPH